MNIGSVPTTVLANLSSSGNNNAFSLLQHTTEEDSSTEERLTVKSSPIQAGETAKVTVVFKPTQVQPYKAVLRLRAERNQFDSLPIYLLGEGLQPHLVVENLRGISLTPYEAESCSEVDDGTCAISVSAVHGV